MQPAISRVSEPSRKGNSNETSNHLPPSMTGPPTETETASPPPYDNLAASRRLRALLEVRELKVFHRHVENVIFYLSSTDAELEMVVGAKELCSKEFNKMLVHRRFGIQEKEWEGYVAFMAEVDEELKRRGM